MTGTPSRPTFWRRLLRRLDLLTPALDTDPQKHRPVHSHVFRPAIEGRYRCPQVGVSCPSAFEQRGVWPRRLVWAGKRSGSLYGEEVKSCRSCNLIQAANTVSEVAA